MIIPEYKAIYVHIPKAAGQSVENFLLASLGKNRKDDGADYLLRPNDNLEKGPKRLAHLTANEYIEYGYITETNFKGYYKFAIVRNPWARLVSFYKFRGFSTFITFPVFVNHYLPYYFEKEFWFFKPQTDFIYDNEDKVLLDYIGKLENLDIDFKQIAQKLKIDFTTLPKNNHSIEKGLISRKSFNLILKHPRLLTQLNLFTQNPMSYKDAYNDSTITVVNKLYERDIDLLKYAF